MSNSRVKLNVLLLHRALSVQKGHLQNVNIEAKSTNPRQCKPYQSKRRRREEEEGWRRSRGDGWRYFQVYRQATEAVLLAFKPGLSYTCVCSIVMKRRGVVVVVVLFSQQRSREPSHSRAGLTSIGLEIKRTSLSDQTSPRHPRSHSFKTMLK